jgi:glycosyltransferase involved in cell wall biosynthesis
MRVLIALEPGVDGVFRYVESLCRFLFEEGVEVHLAYSDRRGSDGLRELVADVERRGGLTVNMRTRNRPGLSDAGALRALRGLAQKVQPDLIHSHSSKAGALARMLPWLGIKAPQLYTPHAYWGMRPGGTRTDVIFNTIERLLGRMGSTLVVSSGERDFAVRRLRVPSGRVHLLPNGVDTELFAPIPMPEKRRLRAALGLPTEGQLLGFLGRSSAQKDPLTLYQAFARAFPSGPVALFHVGRGELDRDLERLVASLGIGDRVFRRPYFSKPVEFYRVVDGFILTSRYEGLSLAALEALSCNLPLILSEAPGNLDLLSLPLSHAWRARPGDVEGFARAIAAWQLRCDPPTDVNHREIACCNFEIRTQMGEVLALYHQLAFGAPGSSPLVKTGFARP